MTWTKRLPPHSGYWWYQSRVCLPVIGKVLVWKSGRVEVCWPGAHGTSDGKRLRGEWSSEPVPMPAEETNHDATAA